MRGFLILLLACIALTALKFAALALVVTLFVLIVWGVLFRPRQMFGFLGFMLLSNLLMTHTAGSLTAIVILGSLAILCRPPSLAETEPEQPMLTPPPERGDIGKPEN